MSTKSLGDPLPGTGNLYAWDEGYVLKLYGEDVPRGWIRQLGKTERALYEAGLPLPEVGELVEIDGCLGQVYERVEGPTLAQCAMEAVERDADRVVELAHVFAEVHAAVHACVPSGDLMALPVQRQFFATVIRRQERLSQELQEAVLDAMAGLPDGNRLCHGDFHPYNVLMSPRGPIVIDWNNAHLGNPLEDVARTRLMFSGLAMSEPALEAAFSRFAQAYLDRYFELRPDQSRDELDGWLPVVAAVRLSDNIPELEGWLVEQIKRSLALE
jgi:aminoglycoside phosphotransferase (APT) family kinase protein